MARCTQWLGLMAMSAWMTLPLAMGCVQSHFVESADSGVSNTPKGSGNTAGGGSQTCDPAKCDASPIGLSACCTNDGYCGYASNSVIPRSGCQRADAPGDADQSCPSGTLTVDGSDVTAQGCCRDNGRCGMLDTVAGLGCTVNPGPANSMTCSSGSSSNSGGTTNSGGGTQASNCNVATCPTSNFLTSCCTSDGKCGYNVDALFQGGGCQEANAPGSADMSCPSATVTVMNFTVPLSGCCRGDGTCGVMDNYAGLGCTLNPDTPNGGATCAGPI